jgi:hypothetical protein
MNTLLVLAIAAIIAGVPTLLFGCNFAYTEFNGVVYRKNVYEKTCSRCVKRDGIACKQYSYYSCWDAYVFAGDDQSNTTTCALTTISSTTSEYNAELSTNGYTIGEHVNWNRRKGTEKCVTTSTIDSLWIIGIALLSFGGLLLFIDMIHTKKEKVSQEQKNRFA